MTEISKELLTQFTNIVSEQYAIDESGDQTHYTHENRDIYIGKTPLVLRPANTAEVAAIVKLAHDTCTKIVPQGGHTGHVAGGVPNDTNDEIVITLGRMNKVRDLDLAGDTMTLEAGFILENAQKLADENDRLFPLSIGSKGSCQIGGNISTNAGGTAVLAYGNTREMVLGLEVVLPNGDVWNGLRRLKKDNTGYNLKGLFVGAEGTLGIVTAAVLKLFPKPKSRDVAFIGLDSPQKALDLFQVAKAGAGSSLTGFEIMPRIGLDFVLRNMPDTRDPMAEEHSWYALMEISSNRPDGDAGAIMHDILGEAFESGVVNDAAIAQSITQQDEFWAIRELLAPAQKPEGGSIKHDISVPVHSVPKFFDDAETIILRELPDARICGFGHMGDGNIHYNISVPLGGDSKEFLSNRLRINGLIHELVLSLNGSISAEHGIGKMKKKMMAETKDPVELNLMKALKQAVDPQGIMNPGKLL
ncbi:MAG: FAD-binding oxidoreductase [Rhizobiaceae bacterium]|nr:FAD-binding oxidoreductase [Rhizobiaceae bacterium]